MPPLTRLSRVSGGMSVEPNGRTLLEPRSGDMSKKSFLRQFVMFEKMWGINRP